MARPEPRNETTTDPSRAVLSDRPEYKLKMARDPAIRASRTAGTLSVPIAHIENSPNGAHSKSTY